MLKISVVIPVYNVENYIEDCLNSVVCQTMPFDEVILINDGSTDKSQQICEFYCEQFGNFVLINQDNKGLAEARNVGMEHASGNYIIFLDSDDILDLGTVALLKEELQENSLDVLYYNASVKYDFLKTGISASYKRNKQEYGKVMSGVEFLDKSLPHNYIVSACLAAYSKEFLVAYQIIFPKGLFFEDVFFQLQVVANAKRVMTISDKLYIRRYREDSIMTSAISYKKCEDWINGEMLVWDYIIDRKEARLKDYIYKRYIINNWRCVYGFLLEYNQNRSIDSLIKLYKNAFFSKVAKLFDLNSLNWNEKNIFCWMNENIDEILYLKIRKMLIEELNKKLRGTMLGDSGKKIGIYGIGKHTETLFRLYNKYIGEIKADICFIVSKKKESYYDGRKVFSCDNLPEDVDMFLLSSNIYQTEMLDSLVMSGIARDKIYTFYESDDCCDLIITEHVLVN